MTLPPGRPTTGSTVPGTRAVRWHLPASVFSANVSFVMFRHVLVLLQILLL